MSYVHGMYGAACRPMEISSPLLRTGSCSMQLRYAKNLGTRLRVIPIRGVLGAAAAYKPVAGDIVIWKRKGGRASDIGSLWLGHTGLVILRQGDRLLTIEGNTGSSFADGDCVRRKWRPIKDVLAIIRYTGE